MRYSVFAFFLAAFVILPFAPSAQAGDLGKDAESFVQDLADKGITALQNVQEQDQRVQTLRLLLEEGFDINAIGKWVMGRSWRKADAAQREAYLAIFKEFVVLTYSNRFKDLGSNDIKVEITESLVKNETDAMVRSAINDDANEKPLVIDWRVKKASNGSLKIVDVIVAGVSMSQAQRSEFASVIKRQGGVDGLIKALEEKVGKMTTTVAQSN